jgi:hypothetical protein
MTDQTAAFVDWMRSLGIPPADSHEIIPDDKRRRYRLDGDKPKVRNGSYQLRCEADGFAVGWARSFRDGVTHKYTSKASRNATQEDRDAWKARADEARNLQHRRNAVAQALGQKRREYADLGEVFVAGRFGESRAAAQDAAENRAKAETEEVGALELELAALDLANREAAHAAQDALALHERCAVFANEKGLPRPSLFGSDAAASHGRDSLTMIGGRS